MKTYAITANLGDTKEPMEFANQSHNMGNFHSRELAERALAAIVGRPDCKSARIVTQDKDEEDEE